MRLLGLGRTDELPAAVRRELLKTEQATREGKALNLALALNSGSRREIVDACRSLAARARAGELAPEQIDEAAVSQALYTADMPDPDLVIRTAGEMRLSNYLLWQISYAELWVTQKCWPEFREPELHAALTEFANRTRRYGGLNK